MIDHADFSARPGDPILTFVSESKDHQQIKMLAAPRRAVLTEVFVGIMHHGNADKRSSI